MHTLLDILQDHKGQRHYIATQHPLLETKNDFWQMVWDTDCHLIVMVNDDENSKQVKICLTMKMTKKTDGEERGGYLTLLAVFFFFQ